MNIYIIFSMAVLAVIALLFLIAGRNRQTAKLTPLAGLAFGLVLAGILLGENRLMGYSLLGVGVIIAVIDIATGLRRK